ncbi:hypothetical protein [Tunturiibacter lichenicola]|uniref:hypothetical protein n=1 Tax=Tunturiibacter lichenicola TaxID=2051959 RepID=UPI003D9BE242
MIPAIPTTQLISIDAIAGDPAYQDLKIVRAQSDAVAAKNYNSVSYRFQHETEYTVVRATLTRKGMVNAKNRLTVYTHPTLLQFTHMVQYDPSNPPIDNYAALGMVTAHQQTQSDFKGQKQSNKMLFKEYLHESIYGTRRAYLPTISGWQTTATFAKTIFVAFDEEDPDALYGLIYLPKSPIMQADGQTQTAALFALSDMKDAKDKGALENFRVTLEIELNMDEKQAGQSFADRNGRGSKKNKNLVIGLDTSSALSQLREESIKGTVFENRIATGRSTETGETAVGKIVDLSSMEQMLMLVATGNNGSTEIFKHYHMPAFLPYTRDFILLLESLFAPQWPAPTPINQDPFRKLYVHGWPFTLKAIAGAYHRARISEIGPLTRSLRAKNTGMSLEEAFAAQVEVEKEKESSQESLGISLAELTSRLQKIDWIRYRKHWVDLTGAKIGKEGGRKTFKLKSTGESKVDAQAQNTASVISNVRDMILSPSWEILTGTEDAELI